jgi:arylformamidase
VAANPVWRGYSQEELDRQYNSRGTVDDVSVYLRRYADLTLEARESVRCIEGLQYGSDPDETLDIYPAANSGAAAPVMVFLHGGDWRALSREDAGFAAPAFTAAGAIYVALNFSLVPAVSLPEMGAQVRRALLWLWQNVARYGGDPGRIHIAGHSSGANLVGQLLMTDWTKDTVAPANLIKSAVMISGLGDLEPVRLSFRNQALSLTPDAVEKASLLRQEPPAACPLLVLVGALETDDYRLQSAELADFWLARGNMARLLVLADRHHFDAVLEWADARSEAFRQTCNWMGLSS